MKKGQISQRNCFKKLQTVNESCLLNVFLQIVQWNEASPWTSRLWWFNAVRVGFILWQISQTCGESVWIFMCLFNVPRFLSHAPQKVHWTRGSSMPMCCVFIWSWNPSFVLNTFAHTSHIRWSIRSCTFKMCIFSMWSDLKLFWKTRDYALLIHFIPVFDFIEELNGEFSFETLPPTSFYKYRKWISGLQSDAHRSDVDLGCAAVKIVYGTDDTQNYVFHLLNAATCVQSAFSSHGIFLDIWYNCKSNEYMRMNILVEKQSPKRVLTGMHLDQHAMLCVQLYDYEEKIFDYSILKMVLKHCVCQGNVFEHHSTIQIDANINHSSFENNRQFWLPSPVPMANNAFLQPVAAVLFLPALPPLFVGYLQVSLEL